MMDLLLARRNRYLNVIKEKVSIENSIVLGGNHAG
jgi:hypothetical protein